MALQLAAAVAAAAVCVYVCTFVRSCFVGKYKGVTGLYKLYGVRVLFC